MAGSRICRCLRRNPPPSGEDKFVGGPPGAFTKDNTIPTYFLDVSWAPTPTPPSTNKLFKRLMKAYLESNKGPSRLSKERKQPFKAKMPDVY